MLHIKKLNLDEIREIYNAYMHEAFPPSELRPFASMEMLYNKNCYPCYGFYDETDSLCAYAYFSCTENGKYALLDYFAVKKDLRGTGIGSKTFPLLRTEMKDRDGLLLEVESVESAEAEEEVNIRRRRIAFYERCGCEMTKAKSLLYGVDFNILVLKRKSCCMSSKTFITLCSTTSCISASVTRLSRNRQIFELTFSHKSHIIKP